MSVSTRTKMLLGSAILLGGSLAGLGGYAVSANPALVQQSQAAMSALASGDLQAFKDALKVESNKRIDSITQDQFNSMQSRYQTSQKVQETINNNDYAAFQTVAPERLKQRINSQEEFDKLVALSTKRKEVETQLNTAAQNQDKTAFTNAYNEWQSYLDSNRSNSDNTRNRPQPTEEMKQQRIDRLYERAVSEVQAGNTFQLPGDRVFGFGGKGHMMNRMPF